MRHKYLILVIGLTGLLCFLSLSKGSNEDFLKEVGSVKERIALKKTMISQEVGGVEDRVFKETAKSERIVEKQEFQELNKKERKDVENKNSEIVNAFNNLSDYEKRLLNGVFILEEVTGTSREESQLPEWYLSFRK